MSNLSDAIDYLDDAEEALDVQAEIDDDNATQLFEIRDRIRGCRGELEALVEEERGEED